MAAGQVIIGSLSKAINRAILIAMFRVVLDRGVDNFRVKCALNFFVEGQG
jgi:hypothetical protein